MRIEDLFIDTIEYVMFWLEKIGRPIVYIFIGVLIAQFLIK